VKPQGERPVSRVKVALGKRISELAAWTRDLVQPFVSTGKLGLPRETYIIGRCVRWKTEKNISETPRKGIKESTIAGQGGGSFHEIRQQTKNRVITLKANALDSQINKKRSKGTRRSLVLALGGVYVAGWNRFVEKKGV